jgi:hypothetical protein
MVAGAGKQLTRPRYAWANTEEYPYSEYELVLSIVLRRVERG